MDSYNKKYQLIQKCRSTFRASKFSLPLNKRIFCLNLTNANDFIHLGMETFFYSNEGQEPMYIHAIKAEMECKYWILEDEFQINEAWEYNLTPTARKEIRQIIFTHFDLIVQAWKNYFKTS